MPLLNKQFLQNLGIQLDDATYAAFSEHFEETLGERVIDGIIDTLDDNELAELAALRNQDDERLQAWLQAKVPDLPQIVEDEVYILMGELAENSDKI
jgi:hypothetical protein